MSLFISVMAQALKSKDPSICDLPKDPGPCEHFSYRYFFNKETGQCESFLYGGCQGNENNFSTKRECQEHCMQLSL